MELKWVETAFAQIVGPAPAWFTWKAVNLVKIVDLLSADNIENAKND